MKTTQELENRILTAQDPAFLSDPDFTPPDLSAYLRQLLAERGTTPGEVIRRCNLDRSYGYQMLNGTRRPTRDVLLTLSVHLGLTPEEAQRLLSLAGRPALYARSRRDAAVLYCLCRRLSLAETEELLSGLEVAPLVGDF